MKYNPIRMCQCSMAILRQAMTQVKCHVTCIVSQGMQYSLFSHRVADLCPTMYAPDSGMSLLLLVVLFVLRSLVDTVPNSFGLYWFV